MKTNHIYIAAIAAVVVLALIFWGGDKVAETDSIGDITSPTIDTKKTNTYTYKSGIQKPAPTPTPTPNPLPTPSPAPTPSPTPNTPSLFTLDGSTFRLVSYNGSALPSDSKYTISFDSKSLVMSAKFCNSMSGSFLLDRNFIKVNNLASTLMYCATPTNLMEIESSFASMLGTGATIYRNGNQLIISHATKGVMVFSGF